MALSTANSAARPVSLPAHGVAQRASGSREVRGEDWHGAKRISSVRVMVGNALKLVGKVGKEGMSG